MVFPPQFPKDGGVGCFLSNTHMHNFIFIILYLLLWLLSRDFLPFGSFFGATPGLSNTHSNSGGLVIVQMFPTTSHRSSPCWMWINAALFQERNCCVCALQEPWAQAQDTVHVEKLQCLQGVAVHSCSLGCV